MALKKTRAASSSEVGCETIYIFFGGVDAIAHLVGNSHDKASATRGAGNVQNEPFNKKKKKN